MGMGRVGVYRRVFQVQLSMIGPELCSKGYEVVTLQVGGDMGDI